MANYTADLASSSVGTVLTARTGTASADTVTAGSYVVWRNTGAGAHNVTLTNNGLSADGLTISNRVINIAAGAVKGGRISPSWGDASGNVGVAIDGTAAEVVYYVLAPN
jgi:plastocyanin